MADSHDWGNVDAARSERYTEYLADITALKATQEYKRRTHRLLHPSEGDQILDVGCGRGDDVLMLADAVGSDGRVIGIDNSKRMVNTARERGDNAPNVFFAVDDAMDISFSADHFDATRADRVLQHLADPASALSELQRVTRPGGRVCICEPDVRGAVLDVPGDQSADFLSWEHSPARNPTIGGELYGMAKRADLADVQVDGWTYHTTEFATFRDGVMLDLWTDAMVEAGVVTREEVDAWYAALSAADRDGMFFHSGTAFVVSGTVQSN